MELDSETIIAPHPFGPIAVSDWCEVDDLYPQPSRGERASIGGAYYQPVAMFLTSRSRLDEIEAEVITWLRNILDSPAELVASGATPFNLNDSDRKRVRRIAGYPPSSSVEDGYSVREAPEDELHQVLTDALSSVDEPMWGRWLDPAQQKLVREKGRPVVEVLTALDARFAEHLDLTPPAATDDTVLVVRWPLGAWRQPPFGGELIETASETLAREEATRRSRSAKPLPRPHTSA